MCVHDSKERSDGRSILAVRVLDGDFAVAKGEEIGGAYFFDDQNEGRVEITNYLAGTQPRPVATIQGRAWALFGQATYSVSSRLSLTGGIRYTDERKDLDATGGLYRLGTSVLVIPGSFYDVVDRASFNAWTPRGSLQVQVSNDTFLYASATRGFKSGGYINGAAPPDQAFDPEFAWSYEGGLKRTLAGGRILANTAVFFSDYQDLQVQSFIVPGVPQISNAGSATIEGVEVEVDGIAGHGVRLAGSIAWVDAIYGRYHALGPQGVSLDAAGHRLNNAPEWSGSGSANYEFQPGRARNGFFSG